MFIFDAKCIVLLAAIAIGMCKWPKRKIRFHCSVCAIDITEAIEGLTRLLVDRGWTHQVSSLFVCLFCCSVVSLNSFLWVCVMIHCLDSLSTRFEMHSSRRRMEEHFPINPLYLPIHGRIPFAAKIEFDAERNKQKICSRQAAEDLSWPLWSHGESFLSFCRSFLLIKIAAQQLAFYMLANWWTLLHD